MPGAVNQIEAPQCLDLDPPNRFNPSLGAAVGLRKKRDARTPPPATRLGDANEVAALAIGTWPVLEAWFEKEHRWFRFF